MAATNKASQLAKFAGVGLGQVQTITEGSSHASYFVAKAAGLSSDTPIEPGVVTVSVTVAMTFVLQ